MARTALGSVSGDARRESWMRNRLFAIVCAFAFGVLTAAAPVLAAGTAPTGTWRLFKDSDGKGPKSGAVIELTFGKGSFHVKAVQSGETVEDDGTFEVAGRTLRMEFRSLSQGKVSGPYSLSADTIVLPFKMLSDGSGSSTWMTATALDSFLAKVPKRPPGPETMPQLLARMQGVAEAYGNGSERAVIAQRAAAQASKYKGGEAQAFYAIGTVYFLKGFYREAWYAFARSSVLKPTNAAYLHNLATVLEEIGPAQEARTILEWVTKNYPNLDPPWGALGVACLQLNDAPCVNTALTKARTLAPENGLYDYVQGRLLQSQGQTADAQSWFRKAWSKGYGGSGNEGGQGGGQ
jgi:cytochrome c-type biogenesis protein CcmH/NrfG